MHDVRREYAIVSHCRWTKAVTGAMWPLALVLVLGFIGVMTSSDFHLINLTNTLNEAEKGKQIRDLDARWSSFVAGYDSWLHSQQYCMRWCEEVNETSVSGTMFRADLYPDLPRNSSARKHAMSLPPYAGQFQNKAQRSLKVRCCRICTADCFRTVVDTRSPGFQSDDATLITVVTPGRFEAVERIRQLWPGPIVILLYYLIKPILMFGGKVSDPF